MAHTYLSWDKKTIDDFSPENINSLYNQGFVFVRTGHGMMEQTRSLRIDLAKFKLSSENKRILKKTEGLELQTSPLPYSEYHWSIGKLAKDFYTKKFGDGTFSANKVKELLTDKEKSNFNVFLQYDFSPYKGELEGVFSKENVVKNTSSAQRKTPPMPPLIGEENASLPYNTIGFCICHETNEILHYCYPFYNPESTIPNLGMGMMIRAIIYAQENGKKYIYLGSFQRPTDVYKLQFEGLEWWDGRCWNDNIRKLKTIL